MRDRCLNPKSKIWNYYGGRGIKICQGFMTFEGFIGVMGNKPTTDHSIDRVENSGNYSCGKCDQCAESGWPFNCRWGTDEQQANNSRNNHRITANGRTATITEWSRIMGFSSPAVITSRIRNGWSETDAVLTATML